jgi:ATP synthase protein I
VARSSEDKRLGEALEQQVERAAKAARERRTVLAQAATLGVLGLLMALPVVGGAYLGRWLDGLVEGYSVRWTVSLIVLGVFLGSMNIYLHLRR